MQNLNPEPPNEGRSGSGEPSMKRIFGVFEEEEVGGGGLVSGFGGYVPA